MGATDFSGVLISTKWLFCFPSISCQIKRYAAHRKPPLFALCCKKQQQQKTPRPQQSTSSLVIRCAHEKLNVKDHRTTPKPEIHTSITEEKDEVALVRKKYREQKTYTGGVAAAAAAAAAVRASTYVCIQTRPISTNPASMEEECEYGLPSGACFTAHRLEVVAVAGLLWIYFVVCFSVLGGISFYLFFFFTSKAHGLLQVRGNLAACISLLVPGCVQGVII